MASDVAIYCDQADVPVAQLLAVYLRNSHLTSEVRVVDDDWRSTSMVAPVCGALILVGSGQSKGADWWKQAAIAPVCVIASLPDRAPIAILPKNSDTTHFVHFGCNVQELEPVARILSIFLDVAIQQRRSPSLRSTAALLEPDDLLISTIGAYNDPSYAERYYQTWKDSIPAAQLDSLLKHVPRGARILDAGCGPGHHTHWLAARGYEAVGIDISEAALMIAERDGGTNRGPLFVRGDMRALPFEENTFDAVWASASCIHLPSVHLNAVLKGFCRVLEPGGHLGITMQVGRLAALEEDGRYFEGYASAEAIVSHLESADFTVVGVMEDLTGNNTRGLQHLVRWAAAVARKKEP